MLISCYAFIGEFLSFFPIFLEMIFDLAEGAKHVCEGF